MGRPLRLGLVGAGRWGRNYLKTISAWRAVRLAALASRNPESVGLVPRDCLVVGDWQRLLDPGMIDALIVATPPQTHAGIAQRAVAAGLPVLVEKPLSLDLGEAIALKKFVTSAGGYVMVGHTHLYSPAFRMLKHISPDYGTPQAIHGEAGNVGPYRKDVPVLWDWGSHDVAMCLDLIGRMPVACSAKPIRSERVSEGAGELVEITLSFPGGVEARIAIGNLLSKRRRFVVTQSLGILTYDDLADHKLTVMPSGHDGANARRDSSAGAERVIPLDDQTPLGNALREFCGRISSGARDNRSLELGVQVVEVLSACEKSLSGLPGWAA